MSSQPSDLLPQTVRAMSPRGERLPRLPLSALYVSWAAALAATLGALFIGEVLGQEPCVLCWYQRVAMFPLAVILGIACLRDDVGVWRYALPLALMGAAIALYHSGLYLGLIPEPVVPCSRTGPSCTDVNMTVLGVPLPLLSLACFSIVAGGLAFAARSQPQDTSP